MEYTPEARLSAVEAMCHPFFDELRVEGMRMPNGKDFPPLFNFTREGLFFLSLSALSFSSDFDAPQNYQFDRILTDSLFRRIQRRSCILEGSTWITSRRYRSSRCGSRWIRPLSAIRRPLAIAVGAVLCLVFMFLRCVRLGVSVRGTSPLTAIMFYGPSTKRKKEAKGRLGY